MFLLEGHSAPDHVTLARFRSIHFAPCSKRILAEVSNILFDLGEISGETIFIDGTKIEANANKYTFVWKKAVTKNQAKFALFYKHNHYFSFLSICKSIVILHWSNTIFFLKCSKKMIIPSKSTKRIYLTNTFPLLYIMAA